MDGGEDEAAGVDVEEFAGCVAIDRLLGGLAEELATAGEGVKELVVEVVAIGEDDEGGIVEFEDEFAAEEDHGEGFSAALGVPDDAALVIAYCFLTALGPLPKSLSQATAYTQVRFYPSSNQER